MCGGHSGKPKPLYNRALLLKLFNHNSAYRSLFNRLFPFYPISSDKSQDTIEETKEGWLRLRIAELGYKDSFRKKTNWNIFLYSRNSKRMKNWRMFQEKQEKNASKVQNSHDDQIRYIIDFHINTKKNQTNSKDSTLPW